MAQNKRGKVGTVEVALTREDFNSLVSFLDLFLQAGAENAYARYAASLKKKMLRHSRCYTRKNERKAVTYFYEIEAALLIKLTAFYVNAVGIRGEDHYANIVKEREKAVGNCETKTG